MDTEQSVPGNEVEKTHDESWLVRYRHGLLGVGIVSVSVLVGGAIYSLLRRK